MVHLVFDLETNGFPRSHDPRMVHAFNNARILSISWIVLGKNKEEVERKQFYIKNKNIVISESSFKVHKITQQYLKKHGVSFSNIIIPELHNTLNKYNIENIVAHNLNFDKNVLLSELYRVKDYHAIIKIKRLNEYCTMKNGKKILKMNKYPKLSHLYESLTNNTATDLHNSLNDAYYCSEIFKKLI